MKVIENLKTIFANLMLIKCMVGALYKTDMDCYYIHFQIFEFIEMRLNMGAQCWKSYSTIKGRIKNGIHIDYLFS